MKFFQQTLLPDPLGPILSRARQRARLSVAEAARRAGITPEEAEAFEADRILIPGTARLHALSYARALGLDSAEVRDSLPSAPGIGSKDGGYLSRMGRPDAAQRPFSADLLRMLLEPLAPLGRATVYLLLITTLVSVWGAMRQLSRVRSIPWVTSNSRPTSFSDR